MGKIIRYSLLTCTIAYFVGVVVLFIFSISNNGWSRIYSDTNRYMVSLLTLVLSEFQGWGNVWYISVMVPWLGSSVVLAMLMQNFAKGARRRRLWGGVSVGAYYVILLLVFAIGKLIAFRGQININPGDAAYLILLIWPLVGFGIGYLSAIIADKIIKFPVTECPLSLERGSYDAIP